MRPSPLLVVLVATLAGCVDPDGASPGPPDEAALPGAVVPPAARVETPFTLEGTLWTVVCLEAAAVYECQVVAEGSQAIQAIPLEGRPDFLDAVLTWQATSPTMTALSVGALVRIGDAWSAIEGAYASGTSPLPIAWNLLAVEGDAIGIHVNQFQNVGVPGASIQFSAEQAWRLDGTLVSRSEVAAAS